MLDSDRRELFWLTLGGVVLATGLPGSGGDGAAAAPAAPRPVRRDPETADIQEVFQGRRIAIFTDAVPGHDHALPRHQAAQVRAYARDEVPEMRVITDGVFIDGAPLPVMEHHGRYVSVLNMHASAPSLRQVAREGVRRLDGADLETGARRLRRPPKLELPPPGPARLRRSGARKNVTALTKRERADLVRALLELKDDGTYDHLVELHSQAFYHASWQAHMVPGFLPWHRAYLEVVERQLQRVVPSVTIPYWDWSAQRRAGAPPFTSDFMGGDGYFRADAGRSGRPRRGEVTEGPFAFRNGQWRLNVREDNRDYLRREMGRDERAPNLSGPAQVRRVLNIPFYDRSPYDTTVRSFRNELEGWWSGDRFGMHNRAHLWVGGNMVPVSSPNDPVFLLNHAYVDKLWADWQRRHPAVPHMAPASALDEPLEPFRSELGWEITPRELLDRQSYV